MIPIHLPLRPVGASARPVVPLAARALAHDLHLVAEGSGFDPMVLVADGNRTRGMRLVDVVVDPDVALDGGLAWTLESMGPADRAVLVFMGEAQLTSGSMPCVWAVLDRLDGTRSLVGVLVGFDPHGRARVGDPVVAAALGRSMPGLCTRLVGALRAEPNHPGLWADMHEPRLAVG